MVPPVKAAPSPKAISQPDLPVSESTPLQKSELNPIAEPIAPVSSQTSVKEISEEVTPPRSDAAHLSNPAPSYPPMSRRLGEQGRVILDVFILANGAVGDIRLKQSSGFKRLDEGQKVLATVDSPRYFTTQLTVNNAPTPNLPVDAVLRSR